MSLDALVGLLGIGGGGLLVGDAYDKLGDVGKDARSWTQDLSQDVFNKGSFTGYGVTGPTGSSNFDATGNLNMQLGTDEQLMADQYRQMTRALMNPEGATSNFAYGQLGNAQATAQNMMMPSADREMDYYNKIRAMQTPEEQEQRLALERRMAAQGRMGINTGRGGAPEALALARAQEEAQNQAAVQAIELARRQQELQQQNYNMFSNAGLTGLRTQGDLANMYGMLQYMPQNALLDQTNAGISGYQYEDAARRNATNMYGQTQLSGLETLLGARLGQANLMGNIGASLIGGGTGMLGQLIEQTGSIFG